MRKEFFDRIPVLCALVIVVVGRKQSVSRRMFCRSHTLPFGLGDHSQIMTSLIGPPPAGEGSYVGYAHHPNTRPQSLTTARACSSTDPRHTRARSSPCSLI